jgi:hypothetical protein
MVVFAACVVASLPMLEGDSFEALFDRIDEQARRYGQSDIIKFGPSATNPREVARGAEGEVAEGSADDPAIFDASNARGGCTEERGARKADGARNKSRQATEDRQEIKLACTLAAPGGLN